MLSMHIFEMIYISQLAIVVKFSCVHVHKSISQLNIHSVDECVHTCSSLSAEAVCLIVQHTTDSACIAKRFIVLVIC